MKKSILTIITTLLLVVTGVAQYKQDNKAILDSLEVLKKVGGFVDGYNNPPTPEETRYYNITRMLFALPFSEAKKLLKDKNTFARAYSFTVSAKIYFDSLTKADLEIFSDTAKLLLYTQQGIIDPGITLGQFCEMAYTSIIEERKTEVKQTDVIAVIETFIKANAKFPASYEPKEFLNYSWGSNDDDIFYEIQHKYKLKRNDGTSVEILNYFVLDKNFKIMLIEATRSNTISADPARTDEWLKTYGKN